MLSGAARDSLDVCACAHDSAKGKARQGWQRSSARYRAARIARSRELVLFPKPLVVEKGLNSFACIWPATALAVERTCVGTAIRAAKIGFLSERMGGTPHGGDQSGRIRVFCVFVATEFVCKNATLAKN
jgi:hypothetical protein